MPLGERPGYWTPKTVGANFEFSPILKPLEPFRNWMTVISELCDPHRRARDDGRGVVERRDSVPHHRRKRPRRASTIDQIIANKIGQDTPLPSLELATEDFTGWIGGCDTQYSCAYMNTISWKNETTPLPMEINPRVVFERMFGRPGTSAQRLARMQDNRSILDSVRQEVVRSAEEPGHQGSRPPERLSRQRP